MVQSPDAPHGDVVLDFARTPVFVVLDGDRVLARISGWTPDHRLQLEQALRAHGLLPH